MAIDERKKILLYILALIFLVGTVLGKSLDVKQKCTKFDSPDVVQCSKPTVCMYAMFIKCDRHTSNNKHKKQSQNDVLYKAAKPKTISHDKAI